MIKEGTTHNSRRTSDFIKRMKPDEREQYIKEFIASCNAELLIPFIKITKHDKNFREVEYVIDLPE